MPDIGSNSAYPRDALGAAVRRPRGGRAYPGASWPAGAVIVATAMAELDVAEVEICPWGPRGRQQPRGTSTEPKGLTA